MSHKRKPGLGPLDIYFAPKLVDDEDAPPLTALRKPFGRFCKRTLDIALSLPIVLLVLPPLCVICSLVHLFQSSGPLFYRQLRCGRDKNAFTIYKFRTMDVPDSGTCEIKDAEVRIFPIGNILRASKIDEFPQFLNVLAGSMSVVGPRPHHFDDCEAFENLVADYSRRTIAKPGITGLAQFEEYDGRFEWNCVESRVANDLRYIREWSPIIDVVLIVKTCMVVLRKVLQGGMRKLFSVPVTPTLLKAGHSKDEATRLEDEESARKAA